MRTLLISLLLFIGSTTTHAESLWDSIKGEVKNLGDKASKALNQNELSEPTTGSSVPESVSTPKESNNMEQAPQSNNRDEPTKEITKASPTSADIRGERNYGANVTLAPMSFPFPMAWGVNGYYISSQTWTFGLDFQQATIPLKILKIDIGEVTERHLTLQAKRFYGNSFNTTVGYGVRTTTAKHAKDLLDLVTSSYSQTASEIETKYLRFGLGNQWQWRKDYSFSVEWFTINVPISGKVKTSADQYAKDAASAKNIRDMESILRWYPSGSILQVGVGMVF